MNHAIVKDGFLKIWTFSCVIRLQGMEKFVFFFRTCVLLDDKPEINRFSMNTCMLTFKVGVSAILQEMRNLKKRGKEAHLITVFKIEGDNNQRFSREN